MFSESELLTRVMDHCVISRSTDYSPIFICGSDEKTRETVQPFLERYQEAYPTAVIERLTADEMTNELIRRVRENTTSSARQRYRMTDLLVVEGVEKVCNRSATMEYLYIAVDMLLETNRLVIFTSSLLPREMTFLEDRNRTQFEAGIIVNLR